MTTTSEDQGSGEYDVPDSAGWMRYGASVMPLTEGDAIRPGFVACHSHMRYERRPRRCYRVCFECGHAWTRWALVRAFHREVGRWRRPSRIYSCMECIHDW